MTDETDQIEKDFKEKCVELLDSFALFYYLNSGLPITNGHLFEPNGEKPEEIEGEMLNLKLLYEEF